MKKGKITKFHIVTKTIFQISVLTAEVGVIGFLVAFIFNYISPARDMTEHISRFLVGSSIYELLIFFTLTQINDIKKDSTLALVTSYKYAELYCDSNSEDIKNYLEDKIIKQLDSATFNDLEVREEYQLLLNALKNKDSLFIKQRLIYHEHYYESESLKWRYSILLRLLK